MDYLGHTIFDQVVAMQASKIHAVTSWPTLQTVKGLRGFLGITGYYRKFIQDYGCIARSITTLTKKDNFKWDPDTQVAFEKLKQVMVTTQVLQLPVFTQPFDLECDALGFRMGVVLMQNRHPIAYFSKALSDRNLLKSAYEREIMALALAMQHWRLYLLGREFKVFVLPEEPQISPTSMPHHSGLA